MSRRTKERQACECPRPLSPRQQPFYSSLIHTKQWQCSFEAGVLAESSLEVFAKSSPGLWR